MNECCEDFKIFDWLSLLDRSTDSEIFSGRGFALKGVKSFTTLVPKSEVKNPSSIFEGCVIRLDLSDAINTFHLSRFHPCLSRLRYIYSLNLN